MFFKTVPQQHCCIVERFGKPVRILDSGVRIYVPVLESLKDVARLWGHETNKERYFIELTEQLTDTAPRECITRDNANVIVDCVISWRIVDPIKAVYQVDNLHRSLLQATLNSIRSEVGSRELDELLSSRRSLNEKIVNDLSSTTLNWGIEIKSAEIQELKTDQATSTAMLQQLEAERRSRAMTLSAEGEAKATVREAEAEKKAAILRAEGQAEAIARIAEAEKNYLQVLQSIVGADEASRILIAQKVLEGYKEISKNPANKVFLPNSMQGIVDVSDRGASEGSSA